MCTTIKIPGADGMLLAQNYDFSYFSGLAVINQPGVQKVSFGEKVRLDNPLDTSNGAAKWVSCFGSVTFNQFGVEFPNFGMNEKGLSITSMAIITKAEQSENTKDSINELQWIQKQLDCYETVEEVLKHLNDNDFRPDFFTMHYYLLDTKDDWAVVEYKDGKLVAFKEPNIFSCGNLPIEPTMAHINVNRKKLEANGRLNHPVLDKPARAWILAEQATNEGENNMDQALVILDQVRASLNMQVLLLALRYGALKDLSTTFVQVVFNPKSKEICFRTRFKDFKKKSIVTLENIPFGKDQSVQVLDLATGNQEGDVTSSFTVYTREANAEIVHEAFSSISNEVSEEEQEELIMFSEVLPDSRAISGANKQEELNQYKKESINEPEKTKRNVNGKEHLSDNPLMMILLTLVIPSILIMTITKENLLGPQTGLMIAILFPLGFGMYRMLKRKEYNVYAGLGVLSTAITGLIGILKAGPHLFAVKEGLLPVIIGLSFLLSKDMKVPLIKPILLKASGYREHKVECRIKAYGLEHRYRALLSKTSVLFASSYLMSGFINYILALLMLKGPKGSSQLLAEVGRMNLISALVTIVPAVVIAIITIFYFLLSISSLTGIPMAGVIGKERRNQ